MKTLTNLLTSYCEEHNKEFPYGRHLDVISFAIIEELKAQGKYIEVKKKNETIRVNGYQNSHLPIIVKIFDDYFNDRKSFLSKEGNQKAIKQKFFNYDIQDYKAEAFEAALIKCNIPVSQNFNQKGIAQYKLPVQNAANLIKLGKAFQKERWHQSNKNRSNNLSTINR